MTVKTPAVILSALLSTAAQADLSCDEQRSLFQYRTIAARQNLVDGVEAFRAGDFAQASELWNLVKYSCFGLPLDISNHQLSKCQNGIGLFAEANDQILEDYKQACFEYVYTAAENIRALPSFAPTVVAETKPIPCEPAPDFCDSVNTNDCEQRLACVSNNVRRLGKQYDCARKEAFNGALGSAANQLNQIIEQLFQESQQLRTIQEACPLPGVEKFREQTARNIVTAIREWDAISYAKERDDLQVLRNLGYQISN